MIVFLKAPQLVTLDLENFSGIDLGVVALGGNAWARTDTGTTTESDAAGTTCETPTLATEGTGKTRATAAPDDGTLID